MRAPLTRALLLIGRAASYLVNFLVVSEVDFTSSRTRWSSAAMASTCSSVSGPLTVLLRHGETRADSLISKKAERTTDCNFWNLISHVSDP